MSFKKNNQKGGIKKLIFSMKNALMYSVFVSLIIALIVFRMKSVELDYHYTEVEKKYKEIILEQKELKAKKAKLLSIKNLKEFAKRYNLQVPNQDRIIVVP